MSKRATKRAADQAPVVGADVRIPVNHEGDVRVYPEGAKIVGDVLELPPSGLSDMQKKEEALAAADARRGGKPFASASGVNLGRDVKQDFGLAAAIREEEEKGEQIVNEAPAEVQVRAKFSDVEGFVAALPPDLRDQLARHFAKNAPEALAEPLSSLTPDPAEIGKALELADAAVLPMHQQLREDFNALLRRFEVEYDDYIAGKCVCVPPMAPKVLHEVKKSAIELVDEAGTDENTLREAISALGEVSFVYDPIAPTTDGAGGA